MVLRRFVIALADGVSGALANQRSTTPQFRALWLLVAAFVVPGVGSPSPASAADACPNAAYRGGAGANLPDCRAWEQATPVDKGGHDVTLGQNFPAFANPNGGQLIFVNRTDIADGDAVAFTNFSSSARSSSGWATRGVDAPADPPLDQAGLVQIPTKGFSSDKTKALVVSLRDVAPGAVEGNTNLYVRDTATGSLTLAVSVPGRTLYDRLAGGLGTAYRVIGASADFKRIVFAADLPLVPGALDIHNTSVGNLYEIEDGQLRLISRDENGDAVPAQMPDYALPEQPYVSRDGRRVTFVTITQSGDPVAYQRIDGTSTVRIATVAQGSGPNNLWPSPDGTQVTFDGFQRWTADGGGGTVTSLLDGVSTPWTAAGSFNIFDVSPDGRYVWARLDYTDANGNLAGGLAVVDTVAKRASLKATFPSIYANFSSQDVQFSADGTKMLGTSSTNLTGYDQNCAQFGTCLEAFLFDATAPDAAPVCVSCGPSGTHSVGNAVIGGQLGPGLPKASGVTDDGRVFFDTAQRLSSADVNSERDVYEYAPGRGQMLISSGTGPQANFMSASASGGDVFFLTADSLVAQDEDPEADIYDARVGGGLAAQQIPRPSGDSCPSGSCLGAPPAVPGAEAPATSSFQGQAKRPRFSVTRVSASARRAAAASGRLKLSATVGAAGRLSARASARLGRRSTVIGRASSTARGAGRVTLTVSLSRAARRALTKNHKLAIGLSVSYSKASKAATQSVSLTAPRTRSSAKGGAR